MEERPIRYLELRPMRKPDSQPQLRCNEEGHVIDDCPGQQLVRMRPRVLKVGVVYWTLGLVGRRNKCSLSCIGLNLGISLKIEEVRKCE